ncbi:MAG: hypothetical protein R3F54_30110 [Alphaproteobacteria bacterium]
MTGAVDHESEAASVAAIKLQSQVRAKAITAGHVPSAIFDNS